MTEGKKIGAFLTSRCKKLAGPTSVSIEDFYKKYGCLCPSVIIELYQSFPGGFVERFPNESVLFYDAETLMDCADELIPIDIAQTGLIPLADFKDNQFLCYRPMKKSYVLYSAIDEIQVIECSSLTDILSQLGFVISTDT